MSVEFASLEGKVALVTGGGRGLGAEICRVLAEAGARVIVADLRLPLALDCAATLPGAEALQLDVGREAQVAAALHDVLERHDRLDVLVNNAAVDVTLPLDELSVDDWDTVLRTNLRGPFLMTKHALGAMKRAGRGHIVNIASTAARRAWPNASAYHASKWGLLGFSHALHAELRPHGIKVTAIIAGGMRTPFLLDRFPDIDASTLQPPANVAEVVRWTLCMPAESVLPEVMVLPMRETSWP